MSDISSIPLNKLVDSPESVRKTAGADTALHELASSIAAHGLQSLAVRKSKKGRFAVVAGGRRLAALRLLADAGKRPITPCRVTCWTVVLMPLKSAWPRTACASRCTRPTSSRHFAPSSTAA